MGHLTLIKFRFSLTNDTDSFVPYFFFIHDQPVTQSECFLSLGNQQFDFRCNPLYLYNED